MTNMEINQGVLAESQNPDTAQILGGPALTSVLLLTEGVSVATGTHGNRSMDYDKTVDRFQKPAFAQTGPLVGIVAVE